MFLSGDWSEYELIDVSSGERLERWGEYILVRPDPQAIWSTNRADARWKDPDGVYVRSEKGGGSWTAKKLPAQWKIGYGDLTFLVKPMSFKHTGLFPEQAVNWNFARSMIKKSGRRVKVLNLFAYTGGASLACAKEGASVVHVDAAKGMVQWARENAIESGLEKAHIRYIVDDCKKFCDREIRRKNRYDAVIMDPPSFGRGPSGELWKIEDNLYPLMQTVAELLSDDPLFFILNSYTAGLSAGVMAYLLESTVGSKHSGTVMADEVGLPVSSNGLRYPSGVTAIWRREE